MKAMELACPEGLSALDAAQMSYTPIDDPRQLYHNVVVVPDTAVDINKGQPSALASWIDATELTSGESMLPSGTDFSPPRNRS